MLTFVDPSDIDTGYVDTLAGAADRLLSESNVVAAVATTLVGRCPEDLTDTFRAVGANLLSRCRADNAPTLGDTAELLAEHVIWLTGVATDSEAARAIRVAGTLIASDFAPEDDTVLEQAYALRTAALMIGLSMWTIGTAVILSCAIGDNAPGGDSIRWYLHPDSDPDPTAYVVVNDEPAP